MSDTPVINLSAQASGSGDTLTEAVQKPDHDQPPADESQLTHTEPTNNDSFEDNDDSDLDPEILPDYRDPYRKIHAKHLEPSHYRHKAPLKRGDDWLYWVAGMEIILRMHLVWPILDEEKSFVPLKREHGLFSWSERMIDTAIAAIFANVSPSMRRDNCFLRAVYRRDPSLMMETLCTHHGEKNED
ncbi:hypothetical protein N7492_004488 [Penicillium capsulatum]|uniref:Uncharacterized protein n=1 Tax=Penicillium capsulatum TaxID=69766 RepID=A0A9W9LR04_9EURO|nr:hypothetical protein N7492_004488 [Penicillium capsulatum]KAJ6136391.1 hypothetical protein N7512_001551 [Penicillium capsulatum]